MTNINLDEAFPSSWLKIDKNCEHGDIITFVDGGAVVPNGTDEKGNPRSTLNITVKVDRTGEEKKFSLNAGNRQAVRSIYGPNVSDWIGKSMEIVKVRVNNPRTGEKVWSIELVQPGIKTQ